MRKEILVFMLLFTTLIASRAEEKRINYGNAAVYYGEVNKKTPMGKGTLTLASSEYSSNSLTANTQSFILTGLFNNNFVSEAEMTFEKHNLCFTGEVSFNIDKSMFGRTFHFLFTNGRFMTNDTRALIGEIGEDGLTISISPGYSAYVRGEGELEYVSIKEDHLALFKRIARCETYTAKGSKVKFSINSEKYNVENNNNDKKLEITVLFENGTEINYQEWYSRLSNFRWNKPNGDYYNNGDFKISFDSNYAIKDSIYFTFPNGNIYEGIYDYALLGNHDIESTEDVYNTLMGKDSIEWKWEDFTKYAKSGRLTYPDGEYFHGSFDPKNTIPTDTLDWKSYYNGTLYTADNAKIQTFTYGDNEIETKIKEAEYERMKAGDYFKIDQDGHIYEFQITYKNLAQHKYKENPKTWQKIENILYFPNGEYIFNPYKFYVYYGISNYDKGTIYEYDRISNDDYKKLKANSENYRPTMFDATIKGERHFNDGLIIGYETNRNGLLRISDRNNENYIELEAGYSSYDINDFKVAFEDYIATPKAIHYKNGCIFTGDVRLNFKDVQATPDERITKFFINKLNKSIESIASAYPYDGRTVSSGGKILEIYRDGEKLDEFEFALVLAKEEGELKREQEEEQRRREYLITMNEKYGKENVSAIMEGKIRIGMTVSLLQYAINNNMVVFSDIKLSSDHGIRKCYDLYCYWDGMVIYIWTENGKITSIGTVDDNYSKFIE